jgi:hypothetical protein
MGDRTDGYMTSPDKTVSRQPREEMFERAAFDQSRLRRNQKIGGAIAGAGLGVAGLSSLINGERDRREQEQYQ